MTFADVGRKVIEAQVQASLGPHASQFDISTIVHQIVNKYGFGDIGEINPVDYWNIVIDHGFYRVPPLQ